MTANPKITFIGAGSTVFMKNIVGDVLQRPALAGATHRADGHQSRSGSRRCAIVASKLIETLGVPATVETYHRPARRRSTAPISSSSASRSAATSPCTVTDFEVPKKYGLRQTIADTLGVGGIMRGLRTVPHLWTICEDMLAVCPDAIMLQYVNPMAINTWAIAAKYPHDQAGRPLPLGAGHGRWNWPTISTSPTRDPLPRRRHQPHGLLPQVRAGQADGSYRDLYPDLVRAYREGRAPKPGWNPRCPNKVRYEMLTRLGYFVTESSEHFAEYTP